jgi:hypothetical protein
MNPPRYRSAGGRHVLLNRSRTGDRILLEDRSVWKVDPGEARRARRWPQWTRVEVKPASEYAYWLIAEVLGQRESVLAVYGGTLAQAPLPASPEMNTPEA